MKLELKVLFIFSLYIYINCIFFFLSFFFLPTQKRQISLLQERESLLFQQGCLDEIQIEKSKRCGIKIRDRLVLFRGCLCLSQGEETESAWCHGRIKYVVVRYDDGLEDEDVGDEFTLTKPQDQ